MLFKKFLKLISEAVCALFFMKLKRLRTIYQHFVILQLPNQRIDFPVMQLISPRITQITLRVLPFPRKQIHIRERSYSSKSWHRVLFRLIEIKEIYTTIFTF